MPQRVIFSVEARADLRAIDRETALRLLKALARFLATDTGNVKQLEGFDLRGTAFVSATGGSSSASPAMAPSKLSASVTGERPIANRIEPRDSGLFHTHCHSPVA
jgi:hypothetical protein